MSQQIKVGDLVMTVFPQPCCGNAKNVGNVNTVIRLLNERCHCSDCKKDYGVVSDAELSDGTYRIISRLIKIDPPSINESSARDEIFADAIREKLIT